jgi:hypothetical protein
MVNRVKNHYCVVGKKVMRNEIKRVATALMKDVAQPKKAVLGCCQTDEKAFYSELDVLLAV